MAEHFLSVIIPCYNCAATLKEAVDSIYTQGLNLPFEVVMVNDASTDKTWGLMQQLAKEHEEVKLFQHEKNLGGGATRNTAVKKSQGDLIFCLDSDDMLTPGFFGKMVSLLDEKKCDAVGVAKSIKFKGQNINNVAYVTEMGYQGQQVPFESLFEDATCPLYSTFLHTRKAFDLIGGYPTGHGFDTQGFAFRFLANGLVAYGCTDTIYLHRVSFGRSYYIREYEAGKVSYNWFKIYEEFLFIFNDTVKEQILTHNLKDSTNILQKKVNETKNRFVDGYEVLIKPNAKENYKSYIKGRETRYDFYWLGVYWYSKGDFDQAAECFLKAAKAGLKNEKVYYMLVKTLSGFHQVDAAEIISSMKLMGEYKLQGSRRSFYDKVSGKFKKLLNKHA